MAYTTARKWSVRELVTAAHENEQVRDNETWLKDQFDTTTGHDHNGANSKALSNILPNMTFVTWLPGAAATWAIETAAIGASPSGYLLHGGAGWPNPFPFIFPLPIPLAFHGRTPYITEIKFYGYTAESFASFTAVYLRRSDLDGTYTNDVSYTTAIGADSTGNVNATVYSGSLALGNYPYALVVYSRCAGGLGDENRIFGFKISWEA